MKLPFIGVWWVICQAGKAERLKNSPSKIPTGHHPRPYVRQQPHHRPRMQGKDGNGQGQGNGTRESTHPPPTLWAGKPLTPLKIRAKKSENLSPTKKTLEICEIGLEKYEGLPKAHQEYFGNGQKWEDCAQKMGGDELKPNRRRTA